MAHDRQSHPNPKKGHPHSVSTNQQSPSHRCCFAKLKDMRWLCETIPDLATTFVLAQDGTQCQWKYSRRRWWQLHFQLENVHQLGLPHWQPRDSRQQVCIHHDQLQGNPNWHFSVCFWGCSQRLLCQRFKGKTWGLVQHLSVWTGYGAESRQLQLPCHGSPQPPFQDFKKKSGLLQSPISLPHSPGIWQAVCHLISCIQNGMLAWSFV